MSLDMEQYKEAFIEEALEHIETLTQSLLILEKEPQNTYALNNIFRSAHTLKGLSGMMGFKDLSDLSHAMEDVFDGLRKGGQVTSDLIDVQLECIDALTGRIENIQNGIDEQIETTQFIKRLHEFSKKTPSTDPKTTTETTQKQTNTLSLSEKEKQKLKKAIKSGENCFLDVAKFIEDCAFKQLRANMVIENLEKKGKITKTSPKAQSEEIEKSADFKIIFVTKSDEKEIEDCTSSVCEIEKVQVETFDLESNNKKAIQKVKTAKESKPAVDARTSQTVRVHFEQLDELMNLTGELVINKIALLQTTSVTKNDALRRLTRNIDRLTTDLQDLAMQIRMVPVSQVFDRFPRLVRDLARKNGKKINLVVKGREIELDRTVLDESGQPLIHIIRNSVDHRIELRLLSPEKQNSKKKKL